MTSSWSRLLAVTCTGGALVVLGVLHCSASTPKPPPDPEASCASAEYRADKNAMETQPSSNEASSEPEVVLGNVSGRISTSGQVEMGREVTVCVKGLYNWIYIQKNHAADLRLFIGGQILTTVAPSSLSPPGQEYVNFMLQPDSPDSPDWKAWAAIVDASRESSNNKLTISIAQGSQVFESNAVTTVTPYPEHWYYVVALLAGLLAALVILAWRTTLLRYTVGANPAAPETAPFSLGLVQMAFWLFLAVAAYVYIWASTHQIHIPMGSVLGLLGISATTGLAASAAALPAAPKLSKSDGPLKDILNDGDGISFHRFQIAVWTLVLGGVFVVGVYHNMSMPEFDASLLTLMGISSGTYVGFKFPEAPKK